MTDEANPVTFDAEAERIARRCGARHFHKGLAYKDNPYGAYLETRLHLWWSEGFNGARAASMLAASLAR